MVKFLRSIVLFIIEKHMILKTCSIQILKICDL